MAKTEGVLEFDNDGLDNLGRESLGNTSSYVGDYGKPEFTNRALENGTPQDSPLAVSVTVGGEELKVAPKNTTEFVNPNPETKPNVSSIDSGSSTTDSSGTGKFRASVDVAGLTFTDYTRKTFIGSSSVVDTMNNIGSHMTDKMLSSLKNSLKRFNFEEKTSQYVPIGVSTLEEANMHGMVIDPTAEGDGGILGLLDSVADALWGDNNHGKREGEPLSDKKKNGTSRGMGIGDANVINPPFQFNPHDDVRSDRAFPFIGRVYNNKINSNFPVATFEVGRIKYNSSIISNTLLDQGNTNEAAVSKRIRGDGGLSLKNILTFPFHALGSVLRGTWNIVSYPFDKLLGLKQFARFELDTDLYDQFFEDMAQQVAIMLNLSVPAESFSGGTSAAMESAYEKENGVSDAVTASGDGVKATGEIDSEKATFTFDDTKDKFFKFFKDKIKSSPTEDKDYGGAYMGIRRRILAGSFRPENRGGHKGMLPFLVGKNVSISESISNSSQPNPMMATLNSQAAETAASKANNFVTGEGNAITATIDAGIKRFENIKNSLFRGDVSTVVTGEGRMVLPDMWSESSFTRSISMDFTFTSPYAHPLAIFENTYVPLLMLIAMSMPRQIGKRTYTNPFMVRVHMPGYFQIPMGMIESLSITRGDDKNNWVYAGSSIIPKTIKVSLSIKDLSPAIMMGMSKGLWGPLFQGNDGFTSYMNILGGLTISEQRYVGSKFDRWVQKMTQATRGRNSESRDAGFLGLLGDAINPMSYIEKFVRRNNTGSIGSAIINLQNQFVAVPPLRGGSKY